MAESTVVQQALDLLKGMQDLHLIAQSVKISVDTIEVSNISATEPAGKALTPDEFDGHGVPG